MVRLVVSGDEVSGRQEVVAEEVFVRRNVGACRRGLDGCGVKDPVGNPSVGVVASTGASRRC
jgi:hypothetical protein